jgi:hypothetical protein
MHSTAPARKNVTFVQLSTSDCVKMAETWLSVAPLIFFAVFPSPKVKLSGFPCRTIAVEAE